ncbi:plasmid related protein [Erwinia sp. V71]|uniref:plasmid related protein n=1 Tax=Erwinia sp. V71 TaxID=3369424 RepID=UPI003F5DE7A4
MTSNDRSSDRRRLLFPIGAFIFSEGVDRLMREGRLDPMPYFQRHVRGDWGDVTDNKWQENNAALASGEPLGTLYIVTRELTIRIFTEADRSATHVMLPSES